MNLKLSYYTIVTEVVENTTFIIFSTRTSQTIALKQQYYQNILNEEFDQLPQGIFAKLIENEMLVPKEENELAEIIKENQDYIEDNQTLYQVIQPSANCQLGCGYCGQVHTKDQFKEDYDDKLIARLDHKLSLSKKYKSLYIAWFGGEPLMSITNIVRLTPKFKALAEKHKISYSAKMVTNGLVLKPKLFLKLVEEHKVKGFEITLDGTAEFHDERRFVKSGAKSFDIIFKNLVGIFNLENFDELGAKISIRCNVDSTNDKSVVPLLKLMSEHNFQEKITGFYVAPIHSWGNDAHEMSLEKQAFATKEIDWFMAQYEHGFAPWLLPTRTKEVCLSVNPDSELIDAFGNIFNCTEVPYVPAYEKSTHILGNIKEIEATHEFKDPPLSDWNELILKDDDRFPCNTCKMLPVCGGACPKNWQEGLISCPSAKHNITDRLALSYFIAKKGVKALS